jgi:hypothetical protein
MGNDTTERRLTPTERLHEVTMSAMTRAPSPPEHTAEVTRNARGIFQFTVAVRGYDLDAVLKQALDSAKTMATDLPYPETNGGTE